MNSKNKQLAAALVVVNLAALALGVRYARGEIFDARLYADSVEAAADTARAVHFRTLGNMTSGYQRRIIQTEFSRDSLDREMDLRPVVRLAGEARVDTLRFVDTVEVGVETEEGRTYEWEARDGPFGIHGNALISPTWVGTFSARVVQVDSLPVGVRVSCGEDRGGVHSASVLLTAQRPLSLVPGETLSAPGVCNPPSPFLSIDLGLKSAALIGGGSIALWELGKAFLNR